MNDAIAQRFRDCFGFGMDLKLFVDVPHMGLDRIEANFEFRCRSRVVMAFHKQFQQTLFMWCQ